MKPNVIEQKFLVFEVKLDQETSLNYFSLILDYLEQCSISLLKSSTQMTTEQPKAISPRISASKGLFVMTMLSLFAERRGNQKSNFSL